MINDRYLIGIYIDGHITSRKTKNEALLLAREYAMKNSMNVHVLDTMSRKDGSRINFWKYNPDGTCKTEKKCC